MLIGIFVLLSGLIPLFAGKHASGKKKALSYILPTVVFAAGVFAIIFVLNNIIRIGERPALYSGFLFAELYYLTVYYSILKHKTKQEEHYE